MEKKVKQLPEGPLFWRIENFPTLAQAQAAAGAETWNPDTVTYQPSTALAAEVAGKVWLFTLGPKGGSTPGASKVTEVGPVQPIKAGEYSCASITATARRAPKQRCTPTLDRKPSMWSKAA